MLRSAVLWARLSPLVLGALATTVGRPAHATEFYVDPTNGASGGDGSQAHPWQTLESLVTLGHFGSRIVAGDTVWLRAGYHGAFVVRGGSYAAPIQVKAAPGETPRLSRVSLSQTKGWLVSGLSISTSYDTALAPTDMVLIDKTSADVTLENCRLFSTEDTSAWSAVDWVKLPSSGVSVRGDHVTIRNNVVTNVRFGISVDGPNASIQSNQIVNFSADGIRGLGDNGVFEYNLVKNVYVDDAAGDANHDDGFQSWSVGPDGPGDGVVKGVVLRGNVFINQEDPNQRFPNSMQGIGCFDGFFEGWVIENNLVVTDHWHGISFYGMKNSRIVNNTVVDINDVKPGPPWIMVTAHKDGTPSENVVVRNNLATDISLEGTNITDDRNQTITNLATYFVRPAAFDFHLLLGSPAINSGVADLAPTLDADRVARPQGNAVDLGAYEWHEAWIGPGIGGANSAGASGNGAIAGGTNAAGSELASMAGGSAYPGDKGQGGAAPTALQTNTVLSQAGSANRAKGNSASENGCGCRFTGASRMPQWIATMVALICLQSLRRRRRRRHEVPSMSA